MGLGHIVTESKDTKKFSIGKRGERARSEEIGERIDRAAPLGT